MTDDSNFTQSLSSAKYYYQARQAQEEAVDPQTPDSPAPRGLDIVLRRASPIVALMLLAAVGALTWKHRQSLVDASAAAQESGFNPMRMVFRASGVEKKFADALAESQRQTAAQFEEFKPAYEDLKFDPKSLWGPPVQLNGEAAGGR